MNSSTANNTEQSGPVGPPHVHHMDAPTAYGSAKLGMWLFLGTEILLFGGLFTAFAIFRFLYLDQYAAASSHLDWKMGGLNTMVLIFSSFLVALAVDAAQHGDNAKVRRNILITIVCGFIFLIIKYFEYSGKYHHGLFPGGQTGIGDFLFGAPEHVDRAMEFNSPAFNAKYKSFFGLYYCMTALHALHVVIGMGLLFWVYLKACKNRFSPDYYTPVEMGGLYWHLVDLIWIYLFPLLYLVG